MWIPPSQNQATPLNQLLVKTVSNSSDLYSLKVHIQIFPCVVKFVFYITSRPNIQIVPNFEQNGPGGFHTNPKISMMLSQTVQSLDVVTTLLCKLTIFLCVFVHNI